MYTCVTKHFYKDCVEWYSGYISTQDMSRPTTDSNRKPKYDIYDIRPVFDLKMYMENETYLNDMFYKNLEWFQESFCKNFNLLMCFIVQQS